MPPPKREEESGLGELGLLGFLERSLQPTLLVATNPFIAFTNTTRSTLDRSSAAWSATRRKLDRNGRSSSQESEGEGAAVVKPTREVLQNLFQPVWRNEAWLRWNETENDRMEMDSRTEGRTEHQRSIPGLGAKEMDDVCYVLLEMVKAGDLGPTKRWSPSHNSTLELHITLLPLRSYFTIVLASAPSLAASIPPKSTRSLSLRPDEPIPSSSALPPTSFVASPSPDTDLSLSAPSDGDLWMEGINGRSEMGTFIYQYAWGEKKAGLGHPRTWSREFRSLVGCLLDSKFQCAIFYGPNSHLIYNDMYREAIGLRHPGVFNQEGAVAWGKEWVSASPHIKRVLETRSTVTMTDHFLFMPKDGRLVESYYTFSYIPFCDSAGIQVGFINVSFETTEAVLASRRLETIHNLVLNTATVQTVAAYCANTIASLEENPDDFKFAMIYTTDADSTSKKSLTLSLGGSFGANLDFAPSSVIVDSDTRMASSDSSPWPFEVGLPATTSLIKVPAGVIDNLPTRGRAGTPVEAMILSIYAVSTTIPTAVLVIGLNPHAVPNDPLQSFINLLANQMGKGLLAATMRTSLESKVEERTKALSESETRCRALSDRYSTLSLLSPVGIFLTDELGSVTWANSRWREISGHQGDVRTWLESVHEEDLPMVSYSWHLATSGCERPPVRDGEHIQFRWRRGNWVQAEIRPFSEDGRSGFVGAITDITRQRKVEALHIQAVEQRAIDAEENRRNQELFIDMASHELRNPLSGVWQNAEVVSGSLERISDLFDDMRNGVVLDPATLEDVQKEMQENIESVESIILCAAHQGRIADDILNMSRLRMNLLSINPAPFDVSAKMREVTSFFDIECQQKQIALSYFPGPSLAELGIEYILADENRLAQILINFLSNGVKCTADAPIRKLEVHLDVYATVPSPTSESAVRVPESFEPSSETLALVPSPVWITVAVQDSGRGLTPEDMTKLFHRFAQANPKTEQYGGSGMGLFVSKQLVALHDGFIEFSSTASQGSCFLFAIPAQRAPTPEGVTPPLAAASFGTVGGTKRRKARPASGPSALSPQYSSSIQHVLIVEDNLINQKVMQRQLKQQTLQVTLANHGQEAIDILLAEGNGTESGIPIGIILMDIEMPVMDGLTAIREIRRMEGSGELKSRSLVIAVTGNAREEQKNECLSSGFDEVAIKPYKMNDLLLMMEAMVVRQQVSKTSI